MSESQGELDALLAAGLYDPSAPDAAERLELLQWLLGQGITVAQLVDADRRGSLYRAGLDALLWPDTRRLTIAEVAAAAGVSEATARRARRLMGLADPGDERVCRPAEIEMLRALASAMALFGEEPTLQFIRVIGTSTAAIAEAGISLFAVSVAEPMRESGASPIEYAERVREATLAFTAARSALDVMIRLQFDEAVDRLTRQWSSPGLPRDQVEFTVAFVDLADSTRLTVSEAPAEFAAAVRDFEGFAAEAAARHGARLVKLIGDSAMLAAPEPEGVAAAALDLVHTISGDDRFRGAHGGIASGLVVARNGDYFGPPVNLAARLTEASEPGEILCDASTAAALGDRATPAGTRVLRGFDVARPVYLLRAATTPG
jgi:class 3 adenylate cyclase